MYWDPEAAVHCDDALIKALKTICNKAINVNETEELRTNERICRVISNSLNDIVITHLPTLQPLVS